MSKIEFSPQEKELIVGKIQGYFQDELAQELGAFDAEFLLDFFAVEIGPWFYNRGLFDAQTVVAGQLEHIDEAISAIEKPTSFR